MNCAYVANSIVYDNKYGLPEPGKTGTISSNPLFKAYSRTAATPDYHLTASSPAIGRGTAPNAYATDLDGRPRNATTGYDLGADQH